MDDPEIQKVRQIAVRWATAVEYADLATLGGLMTQDIVIIHGNGRTVSGRAEVLADFARSFEKVHVSQHIDFEETIIAGKWAIDRSRVNTTISPRHGGDKKEFHSRTLTVLKQSSSGDWRMARAIGVIEQP
jgi:uncharacterized protein (TIGR02246 family)